MTVSVARCPLPGTPPEDRALTGRFQFRLERLSRCARYLSRRPNRDTISVPRCGLLSVPSELLLQRVRHAGGIRLDRVRGGIHRTRSARVQVEESYRMDVRPAGALDLDVSMAPYALELQGRHLRCTTGGESAPTSNLGVARDAHTYTHQIAFVARRARREAPSRRITGVSRADDDRFAAFRLFSTRAFVTGRSPPARRSVPKSRQRSRALTAERVRRDDCCRGSRADRGGACHDSRRAHGRGEAGHRGSAAIPAAALTCMLGFADSDAFGTNRAPGVRRSLLRSALHCVLPLPIRF